MMDLETGVLIIGGGVAGFRAAIEASLASDVIVVTKESIRESSTLYAQGGVAAVLGDDDSLAAHRDDTLAAGAGLCEVSTVEAVVSEAPERIRELVTWGSEFDLEQGQLHLTREGGHSHHRIVHAHGDGTGKEVMSTLIRRATSSARVRVLEYTFAVELLMSDGRCVGALVQDRKGGQCRIWARSTILCTGGAGQIYRETTNPEIATGDGVAMAFRVGAVVADMEFVQFHPTSLYMAGAARHLITEAVRGEGGYLVDDRGERFTFRYHPAGDLAARDAVSRAIVQHLADTGQPCVYLDLRPIGPRAKTRFPGLDRMCSLYGLNILEDRIPVHPSAHYMVGGLVTDLSGRTTVAGLWAAGEVAMSGLHGANRLASNSLLEGLVFGRRAGSTASAENAGHPRQLPLDATSAESREQRLLPSGILNAADMRNSVKSLMWRRVGIQRRGDQLTEARQRLEGWKNFVDQVQIHDPVGHELRNLLLVAWLVVRAAEWRQESRGTHFRTDFPEGPEERFRIHSLQSLQGGVLGFPLR